MKSSIIDQGFSPITITFESEQEVSWVMGLITCPKICDAVREVDTGADKFLDDLYEALKPGKNEDLTRAFSKELSGGLKC